eukprot:3075669-Prymnesium_polylepis.1
MLSSVWPPVLANRFFSSWFFFWRWSSPVVSCALDTCAFESSARRERARLTSRSMSVIAPPPPA